VGRAQFLIATVVAAAALAVSACGDDGADARTPADRFDAERAMEDVRAQVGLGPRPAGSAAVPPG